MPTFASPAINIVEYDISIVVPAVGATVGGLAGIFQWGPVNTPVLIGSQKDLASRFGKPSNLNGETWFTAASFLAYGAPTWIVRAANCTTTNTVIGALSALANTANVANVLGQMVTNSTMYANLIGLFDPNMRYVARWPGSPGNSLRISVCYTANAFSSTINLAQYGTSQNLFANVGVNTITFTINAGSITAANANAISFVANLAIGDILDIGNVSIGIQEQVISNLIYNSAATTGNTTTGQSVVTIQVQDDLNIHLPYSNNTQLARHWEFFRFIGSAPGQSQYVQLFGNALANDELHAVIVDEGGYFTGVPGSVLESYSHLSRATDAQATNGLTIYYANVISTNSKYVWWCADSSQAASNTSNNVVSATEDQVLNIIFVGGSDGASESNTAFGVLLTGYDVFQDQEHIGVNLIMQGKNLGTGIYEGQLANYLIENIAEPRMDCIVLCSPDITDVVSNFGNEMTSIIGFRDNLTDSSYGVLDSGYKYMYDQYNNVYRWIPLNGDIAGLCAYTDQVRAPWWSPAGFNRGQIKNLIQLAYNPPKDERDQLYPQDINPVVSFPGMGTVLFGDKTLLHMNSAFSRINVRRLFIVMEQAIKQMALSFLFEFNDAFTRANFVNIVTPYLQDIKAQRGITDFFVRCDSTNNTGQIIDNNQFVGDIFVKPNRSINWITLNFVAVATALTFSEAENLVP